MLSPYLNLGLLLPGEVCDAVEARYRAGEVPINSAEGFIRQVIGWREYVWGLYWLWPELVGRQCARPPAPAATGVHARGRRPGCAVWPTCSTASSSRAWVHHIPRLMVLSNLANLYGIEPRQVMDWMLDRYIDGAEWVMVPNVMGMGLWADGGRMASKPYVSGGAYVNRMSDYCGDCPYDPRQRTGDDACPFTTLYWDFLARHEERFAGNHRLARPLASMRRLADLDAVRARARDVVRGISEGPDLSDRRVDTAAPTSPRGSRPTPSCGRTRVGARPDAPADRPARPRSRACSCRTARGCGTRTAR